MGSCHFFLPSVYACGCVCFMPFLTSEYACFRAFVMFMLLSMSLFNVHAVAEVNDHVCIMLKSGINAGVYAVL